MTKVTKASPALPSRAVRFLGLVVLSVILLIPLMMIGGIADDRQRYRTTAERDIAASWGGAQSIIGPIFAVPLSRTVTLRVAGRDGAVEEETETRPVGGLLLLPERLDSESALSTERRRRGLFEVPVYRSDHRLIAAFDPSRLEDRLGRGETLAWDEAEVLLGVAGPRALRGDIRLETRGETVGFEPGTGIDGLEGISAPVGDPRGDTSDITLRFALNGSRLIRIAPAGRITIASMSADWPHPSFAGAFLPSEREVAGEGFTARWEVPHLARSVPQVIEDSADLSISRLPRSAISPMPG